VGIGHTAESLPRLGGGVRHAGQILWPPLGPHGITAELEVVLAQQALSRDGTRIRQPLLDQDGDVPQQIFYRAPRSSLETGIELSQPGLQASLAASRFSHTCSFDRAHLG
jgi:hypothetical protein